MDSSKKRTSMDSSFPVFLPGDSRIHMPFPQFEEHVLRSLDSPPLWRAPYVAEDIAMQDSPELGFSNHSEERPIDFKSGSNTLIEALEQKPRGIGPRVEYLQRETKNRALTCKDGVAFASTGSALLDLFHHLDGDRDSLSVHTLSDLLEEAWEEDSLATLKVTWNSRSIHWGKGDRNMFYVALGWLSQKHPRTLLVNLQWLIRGVIGRDTKQRHDGDKAMVEQVGHRVNDYEVPGGVSHGYWKDLLNILVLSARYRLDMSNPDDVLSEENIQQQLDIGLGADSRKRKLDHELSHVERDSNKKWRSREVRLEETREYNRLQKQAAKARKHEEEAVRHQRILGNFGLDSFHEALHLFVARLFAEQLSKDKLLLETAEPDKPARGLSLCAKWAPSLEGFHDKNTLIATTIAEILFPPSRIGKEGDSRELYLKRARHYYRTFTLSPLRKALRIVERDITNKTFNNIDYSQVPSLAMNKYKNLFSTKDPNGFGQYVQHLVAGYISISGAVLAPGLLVSESELQSHTENALDVINAQWNTMVRRIKASGALSDSIAVCDRSASMDSPADRRGVCPAHTAMGLSLLLSAVTKPPFNGKIITFSENPEILDIGGANDQRTLDQKVAALRESEWGYNTDFMKVFIQLILPVAVENKIKQEDMVKRVFVFSGMHFGSERGHSNDPWATQHQLIEKAFAEAGYEVPELVYWDLKGEMHACPAPVMADMPGTALMSGRGQALMKAFLSNGSFSKKRKADEGDDEEGFIIVDGEDAFEEQKDMNLTQKKSITGLSVLKKVIGYKAYDMLRIVD